MEPFKGSCEIPEQKVESGVITVSAKRSGYGSRDVEGDATITPEGNRSIRVTFSPCTVYVAR